MPDSYRELPQNEELILLNVGSERFVLDTTPKAWLAAVDAAGITTDQGQANLASIRSAAEASGINALLSEILGNESGLPIASDGGGSSYLWLGGTDRDVEGSWLWADGSTWSYENWGTGTMWAGSGQTSEPDDYQTQDYLAIGLENWPTGSSTGQGLGDFGQWNDISGTNEMPSLLRIPSGADRLTPSTGLNLAFDMDGAAGDTVKTLAAVFGADALSQHEYVGIGLELFDSGQSLESVCALALNAAGARTNNDIVNILYSNLFGRAPTSSEAQTYIDMLDSGAMTAGSIGAAAANLTADLGIVDLVGLAEAGLAYL